jgi:hypothetical protein
VLIVSGAGRDLPGACGACGASMPPDAPPKDPTPATTTAAIPVVRATPATRATRAALPIAPIPPVRADQYGSVDVRRANRRIRDERRTHYRSRWWFPVVIVLAILAGFWGSLKTDQMIAETLIWPSHGARFVEVSSSLPDAQRLGGRLTIVVAGLGRTSGTGVALALLPSLEAGDTRVFSLVYGQRDQRRGHPRQVRRPRRADPAERDQLLREQHGW